MLFFIYVHFSFFFVRDHFAFFIYLLSLCSPISVEDVERFQTLIPQLFIVFHPRSRCRNMYIHKRNVIEQKRRMSSCADENYKRLAPIANYTFPHPALFPNQGALESQRLLLWDIETQQS